MKNGATLDNPLPPVDLTTRPWIDAVELATLLGVTPHTLRRLAREGKSPVRVRRVGGRWRWSRADLEAFIRAPTR